MHRIDAIMYKDVFKRALLLISLASLANSEQTFTIGLLNKNDNPHVEKLARAIIKVLNESSNTFESTLRLAVSNVTEAKTSLHQYGNYLTNQNVSLVLDLNGSWKLTTFLSSIMILPSLGLTNTLDLPGKELWNSFSMLPNPTYSLEVTKKILRKFSWKVIGIIYQMRRTFDLNLFLKSITGEFVAEILVPVACKEDGRIEDFSYENFQKLTSFKLQAVVVIFDQRNLQELFDALVSDKVNLQRYRLNLIILDFIQNTSLQADNVHNVIGTKLDIQDNSDKKNLESARNLASLASETVTMEQALLYDAISLGRYVLQKLKRENKWNGERQESIAVRSSFASEFRNEIQKVRLAGVTGNIQFNAEGFRRNMSLQVVNLRLNHFKKVGMVDVNGNLLLNQSSVKANNDDFSHLYINKHLRIVTIIDPPYVSKTRSENGSYVYSGFLIDLLNEIAKETRFSYSLYEVADNDYGQLINGKWTGMVGDVLYNKADLALSPMTVSSIREEYVQFAKPFIEVAVSFVQLKQKERTLDLLQFMEPFTTDVWVIILIACAITGFVLYSVDYLSPFGWRRISENSEGSEFNLINSLWFSIASFMLQGADNTPRSLSGRIVVGFFWFSVLILTSTYTANLAAFFTSKKSVDDVTDLEHLLKRGYSFTLIAQYSLGNLFATADYKVYRQLYERMKIQNTTSSSLHEALGRVRNDPRMLYIEERPYVEWHINKKPCEFTLVDGIMSSRSFGIPLRKNSPYAEIISIGISKAQESGFIQERRKYYWETLSECKAKPVSIGITKDGRIEPLQMFGVYSLLIAGIVVSIITMFGEKWWRRKLAEKADGIKNRFKRNLHRAVVSKRLTKVKVAAAKADAPSQLAEYMKEEFAKIQQDILST